VLKVRVERECRGRVIWKDILEQFATMGPRCRKAFRTVLGLVYDSRRGRSLGRQEVDTEMRVVSHDSVSRGDNAGELCYRADQAERTDGKPTLTKSGSEKSIRARRYFFRADTRDVQKSNANK
jgi:hypothetical protein